MLFTTLSLSGTSSLISVSESSLFSLHKTPDITMRVGWDPGLSDRYLADGRECSGKSPTFL